MASPSSNTDGLSGGQARPSSTWGDFNNHAFVIQQMLSRMQTSTVVRVEKCSNSGGLSPVGFVDVTPLVNQIDAQGNPVQHVTIYNVPYSRMQGGANAVIIDPEPGDVGIALFASRDISQVKSTRKQGNPGSRRQYSFSDALYVGGLLNAIPTQYVQFSTSGIKLHSPVKIELSSPVVEVNASTSCKITTVTNEVVATGSDKTTTPIASVVGALNVNGGVSFSGAYPVTGSQISGGSLTFNGVTLSATGASTFTFNGKRIDDTHTHTSTTPGNPTSPPL